MKALFSLATAAIYALSLNSSIIDYKSIEINFTDSADVFGKALWSPQGALNITGEGLGWDGEAASSRDCRIITEPLALGLSWRPPSSISVKVTILPEPEQFILNSGDTSKPYGGDVFIRYSPDLANWSSWQVLNTSESGDPGRIFSGTVRIPNLERETYSALIGEYAKFDVEWRCDEDAAVRWLLSIDEHFFERYIPFIGYVEVLFESSFFGGQRISSFKAEVVYSLSGLHTLPKDTSSYEERNSTPWSFRAK